MKQAAGKEKNNFNKTNDEFKKFHALIDSLIVDYYDRLWLKNDLIEAIKKLEQVFQEMIKNIGLIRSSAFFEYFINEYLLLTSFVKLLLLNQDFNDFSDKTNLKWQKELGQKIKEQLSNIIEGLFKYPVNTLSGRKLLIVQESTSGKFMEFIIFYLLREIAFKIGKNEELKNKVVSQKDKINKIFTLIKEIKEPDTEIQWSKKMGNTDIDILINNKIAIFIKTGLISSGDLEKIRNEIDIATKQRYESYIVIDIAKNLPLVKKIEDLVKEKKIKDLVNILDVGEFLQKLYKISKDIGISIELSRSSIKDFAGFTGG